MPESAVFHLDPARFGDRRTRILEFAGISVSGFRYGSGVAALRVANARGEIVVLPFRGQQIWDARFLGRRLTMDSMFGEPAESRDYLETYGAFLIHCGLTAMGNPGPGDSHALHGELPNARARAAWIEADSDESGPFVDLVSEIVQAMAFIHNYRATPRIRIRPDASAVEVRFQVQNLSRKSLELMYLAHVNFRPQDGGRLLDTVADDATGVTDLRPVAGGDAAADLHRNLVPGALIDPERVFVLDQLADGEGWAHALQCHPDGSADLVSHRPRQLPCSVRWMVRDGDQDALGLLLPATAPPQGRTAIRKAGQAVTVPGGGTFSADFRIGALEADAAAAMVAHIETTKAQVGNPR